MVNEIARTLDLEHTLEHLALNFLMKKNLVVMVMSGKQRSGAWHL